ncbi:hypothetical protein [Vibrio sp. YIC-376]|uniref:hypothetical protein n=1 Tax=Vibrio sp. YIC-376 TaxID=3136162 RepID=UPI00402AFFD6
MRKLILHIGTHKTGSTSIQNYLFHNQKELKQSGWRLFDENRLEPSASIGSCNSWIKFNGSKESFDAKIDDLFFKKIANTTGNVIASSEEMFWIFDEKEISRLKNKLNSIFDEVTIVVYFRRQDKFLLSHYQQGFRTYKSTAARFYGRTLSPLPKLDDYMDKYLNYNDAFERWSKIFGKDNIKAKWFEKETLDGGDVVSDFLSNLSIKPSKTYPQINESLSKLDIILKHFSLAEPIDILFNSQGTFSEKRKFLPTKSEMNGVLVRYHSSNVDLCNKLAVKLPYNIERESFEAYLDNPDTITNEEYEKVIMFLINFITDNLVFKVYICFIKLKRRLLEIISNFKCKFKRLML